MPRGPLIAKSGSGEHITDVDGKTFRLYELGSSFAGHAHPKIVKNVKKRVENGSSFGIATPEEEMLARRIKIRLKASRKSIRLIRHRSVNERCALAIYLSELIINSMGTTTAMQMALKLNQVLERSRCVMQVL